MAKLLFLFIALLAVFAAVNTFPVTVENGQENYLGDVEEPSEQVEEFPENDIQSQSSRIPIRSGRNKRSIITGGVCPKGQVWKPRPFYCITCEE